MSSINLLVPAIAQPDAAAPTAKPNGTQNDHMGITSWEATFRRRTGWITA